MDVDAIRRTLLEQHDELRRLLQEATRVADLVLGGDAEAQLGPLVAQLRDCLAAHLTAEEATLGPILARDPAWGVARLARMLEEHTAEHRALTSLLEAPAIELAARIGDIADDLAAHMDAEERTILHPHALRGADR